MDRAEAEAPVCDITLGAILDSLDKYPKKKPVFKSFCHEYGIIGTEELTEALGLEVLEIIDDRAYIKTMRAKEAFKLEQKRLWLLEAVERYLELHHDKFVIISKAKECWLLAKKVTLIVFNKNDNSVFQPYETNDTKEYFIIFILKTAEEFIPDEIINSFVTRGCKIVRVYDLNDVERKLESVR